MWNLSSLYVDYIVSLKEPFDRKPNRLYVTDVGACPRSVAYRLLNTKKNPVSEQTAINTEMMFDLSLYIEGRLIEALRSAGRLLGEQGSIPIDDRENWGGRYDIFADYNGRRLIEVKTIRSNAFNYADDLPKSNHAMQVAIYDHYLKDELQLGTSPMLWYADRGGANTPREYLVDPDDTWELAKPLMDALDEMRTALPKLPPRLPPTYSLRSYNREVKQEPDYRCKYCDYSDVCKPDMSSVLMAKLENGNWRVTRRGQPYLDKLADFGIQTTTIGRR